MKGVYFWNICERVWNTDQQRGWSGTRFCLELVHSEKNLQLYVVPITTIRMIQNWIIEKNNRERNNEITKREKIENEKER